MNSTINFDDERLFEMAVTVLEMDATPEYSLDEESLTVIAEDDNIEEIVEILHDNGIFKFKCFIGKDEQEFDQFINDGDADGNALASAGYGTDEDYGRFSDDQEYDE